MDEEMGVTGVLAPENKPSIINSNTIYSDSPAEGLTLGDQYCAKIPGPPLISFTLPSTDHDSSERGIEIGPVRSDANVPFLNPHEPVKIKGPPLGGWQYTHRREAQSILPYLFLGPASYARNTEFLRNNGITMIIVIAPSKHRLFVTAAPERAAQQLGIPCQLVIADSEEDMSRLYKISVPLINEHLSQTHLLPPQASPTATITNNNNNNGTSMRTGGKVFLACDSGNHTSAALAAAYLMHTFHDVDHTKAMACVNVRRVSCDFTGTLRQSLYTWHLWLEAQRSVGHPASTLMTGDTTESTTGTALLSPGLVPDTMSRRLRQKRSFVRDDEEDDMEVDEADDAERFRGRRMTPFMDQSD